ncbi:integrase core domain-containing protein [Falsigemmobacter intermedius]|uniref:Integrase catalytic domain-containing protein n=1 Tax=Falsigemmobacter intermedius TaxID=1553448 RepID=A0A451GG50_9RHOB|nr:hypothetical protein EP867_19360 [Falsigemmobacter intermedius]
MIKTSERAFCSRCNPDFHSPDLSDRFHTRFSFSRIFEVFLLPRSHNAALKYECVYLHAWETGSQAKAAIGSWITFYNLRRPHTAHGGKPPAVVCFNSIETDQHAQTVA